MAFDDSTIGPVAGTQFGGGHGAAGPALPPASNDEERPAPRRRLDDVELTEPRRAALRLLRERILERTRLELELPRGAAVTFAAPGAPDRADVFVGRLLSDQNLLAARRRDRWEAERVDAALETGMTEGLAETLELLHDLDELDAESWGLVNSVLDEFHRKVVSASGEPYEPPNLADLD